MEQREDKTSGVATSRLIALVGASQNRGFLSNVGITLVCQAVAAGLAIALDKLQFTDAAIVIVFTLSVLVTAILTTGQRYSLASSVISILSYNFFLIEPRLSLKIDGRDYAGTIAAMVLFALLASYLVTNLRRSYVQSTEASLVAQREQLRANMLRSVSHDLRTPLTSITGNADMLLDEEVSLSPETRTELLRNMRDDAAWLNNVVENLLAITRFEDGTVELTRDVDLVDDVIDEAMRHLSPAAERHVITVLPSHELLLARMDSRVIVQVIVNLVNNAIMHTPDGSHITVSSYRDGQWAKIVVADDGPGVDERDKPQIFDSFYTSSSRRADGSRSVGLGLSLCRTIVNAHGGSIQLYDVKPHGARFVFSLPLEEVPDNG